MCGKGNVRAGARVGNACATVPQWLELFQQPFHGVAGITGKGCRGIFAALEPCPAAVSNHPWAMMRDDGFHPNKIR